MTDKTQNDGADKIATAIADNAPEVQPHAVQAEQRRQEEAQNVTDKAGTLFDPNIHTSKPDGSPSFTSKGYFRKKAGKSAASRSTIQKPPQGQQGTQESGQVEESGPTPEQAAAETVNFIGMMGYMIGQDEWLMTPEELKSGCHAFTEYYKVKGITQFPPGLGIAMWAGAYIIVRLRQPQTQGKVQRLKIWLKSKMFDRMKKPKHTDMQAEHDEKLRREKAA